MWPACFYNPKDDLMGNRPVGNLASEDVAPMAIFRCSKCGCEEDTALCNYWSARLREFPALCSVCDPKIGKWHGEFPRKYGYSNAASPDRVVRNLVGMTRLTEAGQGLAAANKDMATIGEPPRGATAPPS